LFHGQPIIEFYLFNDEVTQLKGRLSEGGAADYLSLDQKAIEIAQGSDHLLCMGERRIDHFARIPIKEKLGQVIKRRLFQRYSLVLDQVTGEHRDVAGLFTGCILIFSLAFLRLKEFVNQFLTVFVKFRSIARLAALDDHIVWPALPNIRRQSFSDGLICGVQSFQEIVYLLFNALSTLLQLSFGRLIDVEHIEHTA